MTRQQLSLYTSIVAIVILHVWWVWSSVRWADITWLLLGIYALTGVSIGLMILVTRTLDRCIIIVSTLIFSGPISLVLGEYGRRHTWGGVLNHAIEKPIEFATSAYVGELVSGAMLIHIAVPLLILIAAQSKTKVK